jgi:YegS/Rv2252/BmrU family lipid kinase
MRIKLIANPGSGRYNRGRVLAAVEEYLSQRGHDVQVEVTQWPGEGIEVAGRAAAEGCELVVACGGDGTLREVVCGLVGSGVIMGVIPLGTGNVIATDLGIPRDPMEACRTILEGVVRRIDIGRSGKNHFILAAGAGFESEVIARTSLRLKSKVRNLAYIYAGLKHLLKFKPKDYEVEADGFSGTVKAICIAVCNSRRYGGYKLKRGISITDGLFDVCVITGKTLLDPLKIALSVVYRRGVPRRNLLTFKTRHLRISSQHEGIVHNDGDVVGTLPMDFEVMERGLSVIVPKK